MKKNKVGNQEAEKLSISKCEREIPIKRLNLADPAHGLSAVLGSGAHMVCVSLELTTGTMHCNIKYR
jgi:hypothetical protein